jgi:hypothetical protein
VHEVAVHPVDHLQWDAPGIAADDRLAVPPRFPHRQAEAFFERLFQDYCRSLLDGIDFAVGVGRQRDDVGVRGPA